MRITSKISHYHKGTLALCLAPFLWLQLYFFALENWLFQFIYNEIFSHKTTYYSRFTHLLGFLCFSGFCLLTYHKQVDQYISLFLYSLWLINYYCVKYKTGLYVHKPAYIRLEKKGEGWQWHLLAKNQYQASQFIYPAEIKNVLIAAATYGDMSFRNQLLQIWHVYIQTQDQQQWVIYQEAKISKALIKAHHLAIQLNTQVKIAESYGTGNLPDMQVKPEDFLTHAWHQKQLNTELYLYKSFSTLSLFRWLHILFTQTKDFIFIAVLAGFMSRYGFLLMVLFGENLGLHPPDPIIIDLNPYSVLRILSPDFEKTTVLAFLVSLMVSFKTIYLQNRKHQLLINAQRIQYNIADKKQGRLYLTEKPDIIVLKGFDKASLIFVNSDYQVLEISHLADAEYDELYNICFTILN